MQMSGMLEGVELGQFIMTTQRGRLFRGIYNGEPVTVKVNASAHLAILCACFL